MPTVEVVTDVGADVTLMEDVKTVAPMVADTGDGQRFTGVLVAYDATINGTAEMVTVTMALSVEQSIELQLRLEDSTHRALMLAEMMR